MKSENFKLIPLKIRGVETGEYTKCSPQHFDELSQRSWYKNKKDYVITYDIEKSKIISMQFYVMCIIESNIIPPGHVIDHINVKDKNNRSNNCRENLRIITKGQNSGSRSKKKDASSKYFGVGFRSKRQIYRASLTHNNKEVCLGHYKNEIDAAIAYDIYVIQNNIIKPINFEEKIEYYKTCKPYKSPKNNNTYYGVTKRKGNDFEARIQNGKRIFISKSELECAKKYDEYVVQHKLDKKLNFPEDHPNYVIEKKIKTFKEDVDDKICKIKLYGGRETIISLESYDKIKYHTLTSHTAVQIQVGEKLYGLARYLLNVFDEKQSVVHYDQDPFNNRLDNLIITDRKGVSENNKKRERETTSKYLNVTRSKYGTYYTSLYNSSIRYTKTHKTEEYAARDRDLQVMKRAPNSLYKMCFDDWNIPGKIKEWENELFLEDLFD